LIKLIRAETESLLDGIFDGNVPVDLEPEVVGKPDYQVIVVEIVHEHAGFSIEGGTVAAGLVVSGRILLHPEKVGNLHHAVLLQYLVVILRDLADSSLSVVYFYARKILRKSFFKPGIHSRRKHSVHELVG